MEMFSVLARKNVLDDRFAAWQHSSHMTLMSIHLGLNRANWRGASLCQPQTKRPYVRVTARELAA